MGGFTSGEFEDTIELENNIVLDSSLNKNSSKIKSTSNIPFDELHSDITKRLLCPICDDTLINTNIFWKLSRSKKKFVNHMSTHVKACRILSGVDSICPICNVSLQSLHQNGHLRRHIPHFSCPYPQCSILKTFGAIKIHMQYHFDELIESFLLSNLRIRNVPVPPLSTDAKAVHSSIIPLSCVIYKAMHPGIIDSPISDYLCPLCHIKHSGNSFYCPICKNHHALMCLNKAIETIIEHLETHVSILCPVCNKSFSKLTTHMLLCRPATDARNICPVCKKIVRKKWRKHLIRHVQRMPFSTLS